MAKSHTHLLLALALTMAGAAPAMAAQNDPPGAAWQDRGIIEDQGEVPVLTPRGYKAYQPNHGRPTGAYAFVPKAPRQTVNSATEFERIWFRQAEGPEWN